MARELIQIVMQNTDLIDRLYMINQNIETGMPGYVRKKRGRPRKT